MFKFGEFVLSGITEFEVQGFGVVESNPSCHKDGKTNFVKTSSKHKH